MSTSIAQPHAAGPVAEDFGLAFWQRRSAGVIIAASLALWAVPIAIGYGLVSLF